LRVEEKERAALSKRKALLLLCTESPAIPGVKARGGLGSHIAWQFPGKNMGVMWYYIGLVFVYSLCYPMPRSIEQKTA